VGGLDCGGLDCGGLDCWGGGSLHICKALSCDRLAFSCALHDCQIVNTFRYCFYPKRRTSASLMLQERRHKEPGFKRFKVKRFFDVSVTPHFWKAERLCDQLCGEYYDYEDESELSPEERETHSLTPCSTPVKVRDPVSWCVLMRHVVC
jgi:hypothetical protein